MNPKQGCEECCCSIHGIQCLQRHDVCAEFGTDNEAKLFAWKSIRNHELLTKLAREVAESENVSYSQGLEAMEIIKTVEADVPPAWMLET